MTFVKLIAIKIFISHSLDKMIDLFDDLSKKISEIEDHILGIEKNADYSKNSLNWLKVEQFKNTIEALMDNVIMSGIDTDASKSSLLLQLFRKHAEFSNLTKVIKSEIFSLIIYSFFDFELTFSGIWTKQSN